RVADLLDGDFAWPSVDDSLHRQITSTAASATALGTVGTTPTPLFTAALLPAPDTGERSDMTPLVSVARLPRPDNPMPTRRCSIAKWGPTSHPPASRSSEQKDVD